MNATDRAEAFWIVEGKYFYDPQTKSNTLHELFNNEGKAMEFAAEKSRKCRSEYTQIDVIANVGGRVSVIAQYKRGEEQFEKRALDLIIQDCRMFAECTRRSGIHPLAMLLGIGAAFLAWAYGAVAVARLFDDDKTGLMVALFTVTPVIALACGLLARWAEKRSKHHAAEAEKWARQIVNRVATTDRVLVCRILTTLRNNPVKSLAGSEFDC